MVDPIKKPNDQPEYGDQPWQNPDVVNKKKNLVKDGDDDNCGCGSTHTQ